MEEQNKPKVVKPKKIFMILVSAILIGAIAGTVMFGVNAGLSYFFSSGTSDLNIPYTDTITNLINGEDEADDAKTTVTDVSAIVEEAMPSIVAITTTTAASSNNWYPFYSGEQESTGAGSGVIISKTETELLIITSNHVVEDTDSVSVTFIDDATVNAVVKSSNEDEDLAIVSVNLSDISETTLEQIKIATMATDEVQVGSGVIAIGNALGYGQSVTTGVISALERDVTVENITLSLLQTDAAINPGNSGGALLNMNGELIGINEAKFSSSDVEGMGFAIPISEKTELVQELLSSETRQKVASSSRGYLGIYGKDVSDTVSQMYEIPEGVYIYQVIEGGAADASGLKDKDVILKIEDETIESMENLQDTLEYYKAGETVQVTVMRLSNNEYVEKQIEVTLTREIS